MLESFYAALFAATKLLGVFLETEKGNQTNISKLLHKDGIGSLIAMMRPLV